jgi:hypothetical protein
MGRVFPIRSEPDGDIWQFCEVCGRWISPAGQLLSAAGSKPEYLEWPQNSCLKYAQCKWREVRVTLNLSTATPKVVFDPEPPKVPAGRAHPGDVKTVAPSGSSWKDTIDTICNATPWIAGVFLLLMFPPVGGIVKGILGLAGIFGVIALLISAIYNAADRKFKTAGLKVIGAVALFVLAFVAQLTLPDLPSWMRSSDDVCWDSRGSHPC